VAKAAADSRYGSASARAEGRALVATTGAQAAFAQQMAELGITATALAAGAMNAYVQGVSDLILCNAKARAGEAKAGAAATVGDLVGQVNAWQAGQGTNYARFVAAAIAAKAGAWSGSIAADADAAVAHIAAELAAWQSGVAADGTLSIQTAVAGSLYAARAGVAASTFAEGLAGAMEQLAGELGGLAVKYASDVSAAVGKCVVASARADAALGVATQAAAGMMMKATADAAAVAQHALSAAAKVATAAHAATSVDHATAVATATEACAKAVAAAQCEHESAVAAIECAYATARINAEADHAHAVVNANTGFDLALAGLTVQYGGMRTALAVKIAGKNADAAAAKAVENVRQHNAANVAEIRQAWDATIADLEAAAAAGSAGGWSLNTAIRLVGGLISIGSGLSMIFSSGVAAVFTGGAATPFALMQASLGLGFVMAGADQAWTALANAMYGGTDRTTIEQILDSHTGDKTTTDWLMFGGSLLFGGAAGWLSRAVNRFDTAGNCANWLTRMNLGLCFSGDTLVHVTALAGDDAPTGSNALGSDHADGSFITAGGSWLPATDGTAGSSLATLPATRTIPIRDVPLGCRVLADNPRPEELDDTWPEPEQATWVTLGLALIKADGTPVKAEFLRPREWVERLGFTVGGLLPVGVSELDIDCEAVVTSITPCPEIAQGEGRVVTGRFVTRDAGNLVTVALENGTEIRATDVHPVWSVDREEWVPAGELEPGELVDTLAGPVAVHSVDRLESAIDVYNIEVHGEHVFRVTADGVLVHNACPTVSDLRAIAIKGFQVHHILPEYLGKMLGYTSSQMAHHPGALISQWMHTGALNPSAVHKAISRYLPPMTNGRQAVYSPQQILDGLQQAYRDLNRLDWFQSIEGLILR